LLLFLIAFNISNMAENVKYNNLINQVQNYKYLIVVNAHNIAEIAHSL